MLDISRIKAIGLDLDDTLWPIWPVITRAEAQMLEFLQPLAPGAAAVFADPVRRQAVRAQVVRDNPDLSHNMSVLRLESIRSALRDNDEDVALPCRRWPAWRRVIPSSLSPMAMPTFTGSASDGISPPT